MAEFKVGDRVVYTGNHPSGEYRNSSRVGLVGTVHHIERFDSIWVTWENHTGPRGVYASNIAHYSSSNAAISEYCRRELEG